MLRNGLGANFLKNCKAIFVRHVNVEQNDIWQMTAGFFKCIDPVFGFDIAVSLIFKIAREQQKIIGQIISNEDREWLGWGFFILRWFSMPNLFDSLKHDLTNALRTDGLDNDIFDLQAMCCDF